MKDRNNLINKDNVLEYFSGDLSLENGRKMYKKLNSEIEILMKKVQEMPADSKGEKVIGTLKRLALPAAYLALIAIPGLTYPMITLAALSAVGSVGNIQDLSKYDDKNWNKTEALRSIKNFSKKVESTYAKYYDKDAVKNI